MRNYTFNIVFIVILTCLFTSCSRYNYIPQTAQSNKQEEIYYQEQDLSSSKGSHGIEPYRNTIENEANIVKGNNQKEGLNQFQKSIISTRQAYLVKAIVKKTTKNQVRISRTLDSLANINEPGNTKIKDSSKGFAIAGVIAGVLGIITATLIPIIGILLGLIASIIGLGELIYMIFNWFQKHKRHSPILWLLCILGLIIGIVAIYLGFQEALKPLGNFNMGSGNYF